MPKFEPNKWNKDKYTRKSHNCYAYFLNKKSKKIRDRCRKRIQTKKLRNTTVKTMNQKEKCRKCFRPKPGKAAGLRFTKKNYNCRDVVNRVLLDNKSIRKTSRYGKCPKKHYKGVVFVRNDYIPGVEWFHFARQDSNKNGHINPDELMLKCMILIKEYIVTQTVRFVVIFVFQMIHRSCV